MVQAERAQQSGIRTVVRALAPEERGRGSRPPVRWLWPELHALFTYGHFDT